MGTRSITHIHEMKSLDDNERVVCSFFRHWDGYPSGHGDDLAGWLKTKRLVNGISTAEKGEENIDFFNRAGTMAVKLMGFIQDESGCEVISTGADDMWEEYTYHIYFRDGLFYIGIGDIDPIPVDEFNGVEIEQAA
ncbi:MAG: hypothetical protein ABFS03_00775 [Chloroflexota bacterium]